MMSIGRDEHQLLHTVHLSGLYTVQIDEGQLLSQIDLEDISLFLPNGFLKNGVYGLKDPFGVFFFK